MLQCSENIVGPLKGFLKANYCPWTFRNIASWEWTGFFHTWSERKRTFVPVDTHFPFPQNRTYTASRYMDWPLFTSNEKRHEFVLNKWFYKRRRIGEMGVRMLFSSAFYSQNLRPRQNWLGTFPCRWIKKLVSAPHLVLAMKITANIHFAETRNMVHDGLPSKFR